MEKKRIKLPWEEKKDPEFNLNQIEANKKAKWNWKINMHCWTCGNHGGCTTVFFDRDNKLIAGLICEKCWDKWVRGENNED